MVNYVLIPGGIRCVAIRALRKSSPPSRRRNRKAQPSCSSQLLPGSAYIRRKYWEITADNLSKAGWSWGCVSAIDSNGRTICIADAHRDDGKRLVAHADEKLTAFLELEYALSVARDS